MKDNMLNQLQRKVFEVYEGGVFAYIADSESAEKVASLLTMSEDLLLGHLINELSDREQCDSVACAKRRLDLAIRQIQAVQARL